jgi:hypothetical protein
MGLSDKFKQITEKAKESAVEHREQISGAVETAGVVADKRTRGRYSDKIAKAASKAEAAVDRFAGHPVEEPPAAGTTAPRPVNEEEPPAAGTTGPRPVNEEEPPHPS